MRLLRCLCRLLASLLAFASLIAWITTALVQSLCRVSCGEIRFVVRLDATRLIFERSAVRTASSPNVAAHRRRSDRALVRLLLLHTSPVVPCEIPTSRRSRGPYGVDVPAGARRGPSVRLHCAHR